MSHFSKIKTNIYSINILKKTLNDLGFIYKDHDSSDIQNLKSTKIIHVFNDFDKNNHPIFAFEFNGSHYELVADLHLWKLEISLDYFMEKLTQQYAYNVVVQESVINGFDTKLHMAMDNGSIKVIMEKYHSD